MIYTYIRNGKIRSSTNSTGHIIIEWKEAVEFAQRYFEKKAKQQARIQQQLKGH